MSDHGPCNTPFECHEHEGGASAEPDHDTMIEQLVRELFALGDTGGNWAEETEESMGLPLPGEYTQTTYSPP
jgi:hypothetical protein